MDNTSVGLLVHDVPLRWSRVSPRVVVRRFHNARDDPPADKKCQGAARSNLRRHDKQGARPSTKEEAQATTGVDATEHGSRFQGE
jgi:hypothetical protein